MKFKVKRSEWFRGLWETNSALFVKRKDRVSDQINRKRCCLGFFANACNLSDRQITNCHEPSDVSKVSCKKATIDWKSLSDNLVQNIILINDDGEMSDKQREKKLTKLFGKAGHEVVFVD